MFNDNDHFTNDHSKEWMCMQQTLAPYARKYYIRLLEQSGFRLGDPTPIELRLSKHCSILRLGKSQVPQVILPIIRRPVPDPSTYVTTPTNGRYLNLHLLKSGKIRLRYINTLQIAARMVRIYHKDECMN